MTGAYSDMSDECESPTMECSIRGYESPLTECESPTDAASPVRTNANLVLLRVTDARLSFGCMHAVIEGTTTPATLMLLAHRRQRLLGGYPRVGDIVACEHKCHSMYEGRVLMLQEEFANYTLLRRCLPYDITEQYFGIRRPLIRVEP